MKPGVANNNNLALKDGKTPQDSSSNMNLAIGQVVGGKFQLQQKLGQGSFGCVFQCVSIQTNEIIAVKLQKRHSQNSMLVREIKVLMQMKDEKGFSKLYHYGQDDQFNFVAMSYLGKNMDSVLRKSSGQFSLPCAMNVAEQLLTRLEMLHFRNLIHRDIKPQNFVIGHGSNVTTIYLIDFGLAKYYRDNDGTHIPFVQQKGMIGTARYASVNAHLGYEQSRRDDLEALGYVIIYFLRGRLPWQNIYAENKEDKYQKIQNMKISYDINKLCENCPPEMLLYFKHVKALNFTEAPNYSYLRKLFKRAITNFMTSIEKDRAIIQSTNPTDASDPLQSSNNDEQQEKQVKTINPAGYDWEELPEFSRGKKRYKTELHGNMLHDFGQNGGLGIAPGEDSPNKIGPNGQALVSPDPKAAMRIKQIESLQCIPKIHEEKRDSSMEESFMKNNLVSNNMLLLPNQKGKQGSYVSAGIDTSKNNNYHWTNENDSNQVPEDDQMPEDISPSNLGKQKSPVRGKDVFFHSNSSIHKKYPDSNNKNQLGVVENNIDDPVFKTQSMPLIHLPQIEEDEFGNDENIPDCNENPNLNSKLNVFPIKSCFKQN